MVVPLLAAALPGVLHEVLPLVLKNKGQDHGVPVQITNELVTELAGAVATKLAENPQVKNEMNAEKPYQSRVAVGSAVGALGVLVPIVANFLGQDISSDQVVTVLGAIVTLWGCLYALYGRFASGLRPLFDRS